MKKDRSNLEIDIRCDCCDEDYKHSDAVGGVLLNSSFYCPVCATKAISFGIMYKEERHLMYSFPEETFKEFIQRAQKFL